MEQLSRANQNQLSTPSTQTAKEDAIETLLAMLSVARQANAKKPEFDLYTPFLMAYELKHIKTAIERLSLTPRAEGETAFPALGTVLEAVRAVVRATRPSVEQEATDKWLAYLEKCKAEGVEQPDEEMLDTIASLNSKFGLQKPKEPLQIDPVLMVCPHCQGELPVAPNIRFWEPEELRNLADVMEKNRSIAAANRAAHLASLEVTAEAVEEVQS